MKEVICNSNQNNKYKITVGKSYNVIDEEENYFFIVNDNNKTVRYSKEFFDDLGEEEKAVKTEQDMIDSIHYDDNYVYYTNLENQEKSIESELSFQDSNISCGIISIKGINSTWNNIRNHIPEDDDYDNLAKSLLAKMLAGEIDYFKNNQDDNPAMFILSTNVTGNDETLINFLDNYADEKTEELKNNNSLNMIKMWIIHNK